MDRLKLSNFLSAYVQNKATFCGDHERSRFDAGKLVRTIDSTVNGLVWKFVIAKQFSNVAGRQILVLDVLSAVLSNDFTNAILSVKVQFVSQHKQYEDTDGVPRGIAGA